MADEAVVAPPVGALGKLADMFDAMADSADPLLLELAPVKVTPGRAQYAMQLKDRFTRDHGSFSTKVENLQVDFRALARHLREVELSYQKTEIDNKDDIEHLRGLVEDLAPRNPGIEKTIPLFDV